MKISEHTELPTWANISSNQKDSDILLRICECLALIGKTNYILITSEAQNWQLSGWYCYVWSYKCLNVACLFATFCIKFLLDIQHMDGNWNVQLSTTWKNHNDNAHTFTRRCSVWLISTAYASDSELLSSPLMILSKTVENVHCSSTR